MSARFISILILLALVNSFDGAFIKNTKALDVYKSIYYDPETGIPLKGEIEDSGRQPLTRIGFKDLPCSCKDFSCGCCAGINLPINGFNQQVCTNVTFNPTEFSIKADVSMNNWQIYSNEISAKNPPALCVPIPNIPVIKFCIKFYDVYMPGTNLHACIDFETKVINSPIFVLHFNCVQMGTDGVSWTKPVQVEDLSEPEIAVSEVYDSVNFEIQDLEVSSNDTTTLSAEEEDNIGQLKLR